MKRIEIFGKNYFGKWEKSRTACRAIVLKENQILLSYETRTGQWMLPGGGLEEGEAASECCIREVAEETGFVIRVTDCPLEIDEYYEEWKYISKYFIAEVVGKTERKLTEREKRVGMEPRWLPVEEIKRIVSTHNEYADRDEMRRGIYLREYTALCELLKG